MAARSDNFNRADGALGAPSDGGSAWLTIGNAEVVSNQAAGAAFSAVPGQTSRLEASNADVDVQLTLKLMWNSGIGPVVRCTGASDYIGLKCTDVGLGGGAPLIVKVEAGVETTLATC